MLAKLCDIENTPNYVNQMAIDLVWTWQTQLANRLPYGNNFIMQIRRHHTSAQATQIMEKSTPGGA